MMEFSSLLLKQTNNKQKLKMQNKKLVTMKIYKNKDHNQAKVSYFRNQIHNNISKKIINNKNKLSINIHINIMILMIKLKVMLKKKL